MFRDAYALRRCIVPVDGFFEWRAIKGARAKQPYAITMKDGSPFGLTGLWENWKNPTTGVWERTFAVITVPSNKLVARNSVAERLIGSIRRECVDHFVVLGEAHLRRILRACARYYNDIRTHRSLDKDAPVSRPVDRTRIIRSDAILGGLHHHYVQV